MPIHLPPPLAGFTAARAWSLGYADSPRIPLVADVVGNGISAIVSVNPAGDGSIDVDLGITGLKASGGIGALANFGKNCQAAVAGTFPGAKRASVVGIFGGTSLGVADDFIDGHFKNHPNWVKLPEPLTQPHLALIDGGASILAFSSSGKGFEISIGRGAVRPISVPRNLIWIGDEGDRLVAQKQDGQVFWLDRKSLKLKESLGKESPGSLPCAIPGAVAFNNQVWTPQGMLALSKAPYAPADDAFAFGTADASGRPVLYEFRQGNDYHRGGLILKRTAVFNSDANAVAADPSLPAYWQDNSNDGLLDGWKLSGFRGLDLKGMGCTPGHADVICLVSRFDDVDQKHFDGDMKKIVKFYQDLKVTNPDGTTGIRFHPIFLNPVTGADKSNSWWVNRDKFLPAKWRGVVHWMQVTPGGGGQADELSNGGTCGQGALWAVFVHEFGHQLGLNHEGFMNAGASPVYTSLMNYTWSYHFEDSLDNVHYSDGRFARLKLREDDLDETLPYPYEQVKFLAMGPYHFHMKPAGNQTLIDWNWDGVFGEKHVKATINYAYSTTAGERDTSGYSKTAPWIFVHQKQAFVLYGTNDLPVDLKIQPTLSPTRPGKLLLKKLIAPTKWDKEWTLVPDGLIGDPTAESFGRKIVCVYPTLKGLELRTVEVAPNGPKVSDPNLISPDPTLVPTMGYFNRQCYLFDWNPKTHEVGYRRVNRDGKLSDRLILDVPSSNPVGLTTDTIAHQAILGLTQDQPDGKTNRWQIRRYVSGPNGALVQHGQPEWVEGEKGGARGTGRITVLFDASRDGGPKGRVLYYGKGITDDKNPWSCSYVGQQIADKSFNGGWIVKRYYDEWTQTRSAPAAAWFGSDILFAYRWTSGDQSESDNKLQIGYHGLGIESGIMTDFNDLAYIRDFGLANSLLNLEPAP